MFDLRLEFPVFLMCRVLGVSLSGYHAWQGRSPSRRAVEDGRLSALIRIAHRRTRETYGAVRLQQDLVAQGEKVGVSRVRRLRKQMGIRCRQKRKFKVTTDSKHRLPVAANRLEQRFAVDEPGKVWLTDITYIPTDEGWLYLAGHKDLFSKEIVGYAMSGRMSKNLVSQSLFRAVAAKRPPPGLVHHSDRGSQYCSHEYRRFLDQFKMHASMSRRGNCYDNAPMESFWGLLKTELVFHRRFATRREAARSISEFIEIFYNRQRRQKELGYLSPAAFERKFYQQRQAADRFGFHY
jgi:transposase InsO family protein